VRKALNDNPIAQIAVLTALVLLVGFLMQTRVANRNSDSSGASTTASDAGATPAPAIDSASTTPGATTGTTPGATSSDQAPSTATSPADGAAPPAGSAGDASIGEFTAGPGLPAPVVKAYEDDQTVVLLVQRRRGIDDEKLRENVQALGGKNGVALFVTNAGHIARYSRITQGVDVDRVPALIVLRPRNLTKGTPEATLSYGFRGPESVEQAVRDALYKGPRDLPYHPR
jgi:hypothetical protein